MMIVEAVMKTDSVDPASVAASLQTDNVVLEDLCVETFGDNNVVTKVKANGIPTLISTLDDILACQIAAEKVMIDG